MLTSTEKNFILRWQEQKEGPRWKFYALYIMAWTVVIFLCLLFLVKFFVFADGEMGGLISFLIVLPGSIILAAVTTHVVYRANEKRLQEIIEREKQQSN